MNYFLIVTLNSIDDETNSNCNNKEKVEDETNSNCASCLVEDESVRLGGMHAYSLSLDFVKHAHTCQPFHLENDLCDKFSSVFYI